MTPGTLLREYRFSRGWTQLQASVRAGITQQWWAKLETDVHCPSIRTMDQIASNLGLEFFYEFRPKQDTNRKVPRQCQNSPQSARASSR